ncbi:MAG: aldo/keto reductase [Bryobacteraceae bacterium]
MTIGRATPDGTKRYAARFPAYRDAGFYREAGGLQVSSLGLGTYLGNADDETDRRYAAAVLAAVRGGVNFLDTAINYRHQRSERSIGAALRQAFAEGFAREEIAVCTKAGFLTPGAIDAAVVRPPDVVGRMHSMAPDFLADQIDRSRANLDLDTIDVFYLHNPETQLGFVPREEFLPRIRAAFDRLESLVAQGKIAGYGAATWDGFRKPGMLDVGEMVRIAREAGGAEHHFRFIQVPLNLAMAEAFMRREDGGPTVLEAADREGLMVVASATLMQARLTHDLPEALPAHLPGPRTDAQRAIQFTRSTPGIAVALVGMSREEHVTENLGVAAIPPAAPDRYLGIYR